MCDDQFEEKKNTTKCFRSPGLRTVGERNNIRIFLCFETPNQQKYHEQSKGITSPLHHNNRWIAFFQFNQQIFFFNVHSLSAADVKICKLMSLLVFLFDARFHSSRGLLWMDFNIFSFFSFYRFKSFRSPTMKSTATTKMKRLN